MPDSKVYVIRNVAHQPCITCNGVHDYISRKSNHARCGAPVGFSYDAALNWARAYQLDDQSVILAPDDTLVVLDDSARKLRQQGGGASPLDQLFIGMRMA